MAKGAVSAKEREANKKKAAEADKEREVEAAKWSKGTKDDSKQ